MSAPGGTPAMRMWRALVAAVETVDGLRVYSDPGAVLDPPAAIVGPPAFTFGGPTSDPVGARFVVVVCVPFDDRAMDRLLELVPEVTAAVESETDAVTVEAMPSTWQSNQTALPSYEISVETSLNDRP